VIEETLSWTFSSALEETRSGRSAETLASPPSFAVIPPLARPFSRRSLRRALTDASAKPLLIGRR